MSVSWNKNTLPSGVEAQTLTVWKQANGYRVPRILYLNKMDRGDASAEACARSVADKLQAQPLLLHTDVRLEGRLIGESLLMLVDLSNAFNTFSHDILLVIISCVMYYVLPKALECFTSYLQGRQQSLGIPHPSAVI